MQRLSSLSSAAVAVAVVLSAPSAGAQPWPEEPYTPKAPEAPVKPEPEAKPPPEPASKPTPPPAPQPAPPAGPYQPGYGVPPAPGQPATPPYVMPPGPGAPPGQAPYGTPPGQMVPPGYPPGYPLSYPPGYPPPAYPGYGPWGQPPPPPPPKEKPLSGEPRLADHLLDWLTFSIGFTGGAGVAILDKPDDQTVKGQRVTPEYPGFVGWDTAVGGTLELRILGYVGLEIGFLYASESGATELSVTNTDTGETTKFDLTIGHSALHVPLLLKGCIPGKAATPMLFIGPEFVSVADEADLEIDGVNLSRTSYSAYTESYTMLAVGFGVEFNLPIPKVDLRIPFSLRLGYNPGVSDAREERAQHLPEDGPPLTEQSYSTAWKYTIRAHLGASVNF